MHRLAHESASHVLVGWLVAIRAPIGGQQPPILVPDWCRIEEVLGNFPYTEAIIWETLRLHGPAPLIISVARQPVTICGFDFPAV
jgi:cytochrome P450